MNGEIRSDWSIINAHPLMAVTEFRIGIILNSRNGRIEDLLVQHILSVMRFLLGKYRNGKQETDQSENNVFHYKFLIRRCLFYLMMVTDPVIGLYPFFRVIT